MERGGGGLILTAKNSQNLSTMYRKPRVLTEKQTGTSDFFVIFQVVGFQTRLHFQVQSDVVGKAWSCVWLGRPGVAR